MYYLTNFKYSNNTSLIHKFNNDFIIIYGFLQSVLIRLYAICLIDACMVMHIYSRKQLHCFSVPLGRHMNKQMNISEIKTEIKIWFSTILILHDFRNFNTKTYITKISNNSFGWHVYRLK